MQPALFPFTFKDAVVLTLDGVGEWATTIVAVGKNELEILKEIHFLIPWITWSTFTYDTGFK